MSALRREKSDTELYWTIDLTREFGVTPRTLRYYEERGLLHPIRRGTHRRYPASQRARLAEILKGKALGLTVAEIAEALIAGHGLVKLSARQVEAQLEHLERQKAEIEAAIAALKAHPK
jgi:DNA-binding transcriptional MerR regulator